MNQSNFNSAVKSAVSSTENSFKSTMKKVGGYVVAAFSVAAVTSFAKSAVNAASEIQSAWTGLNSIASGTEKSFAEAQKFISEYTNDGLVSVTEAVTSYKNLLSRGYDTTQIENTLTALKDSASFGRQASYDLGEAVVTATEGLKNENSILVDNAGVTKNVAKMWEDWAAANNTTTNAMTQAQKIEAEYNGILEETKFQTGDAATYTQTFGGQVQRLNASFTSLKVAVGKVVTPIAQLFIPVINSAVTALTNLFNGLYKVLNLFGLEFNEIVSNSSSSVSDLSDSITDTADSAVSAAKTINKAFANVDEINVLSTSTSSTNDDSSSTDDTSSIASNVDVSNVVDNATNSFSNLIDKVKELSEIFKNGFNISFGNTNFDSILSSITNIKKSLKNIFTDKEVLDSVNSWVNNVVYSFGQIVGSIARIGVNVASFYLGSIEKYLQQNSDRIKMFIVSMFNISTKDIRLTASLWDSLGQLSDIFNSTIAKKIGANIISIFYNPLMSATELLYKFIIDLKSVFIQPIVDNIEKIKLTFENLLKPLEVVTSTLAEMFSYVGDKWNEIYDNSIAPFIEKLKNGISDTFSKFLDVYNEYFVPFIQGLADKFQILWSEHLKPLSDKFCAFISSTMDLLGVFWDSCLKPLIDWMIQNILPVIVPILENLYNTIFEVIGSIADIVGGLFDILSGIIDFVVGIFTGDWEKAWNGVKSIVSGIWEIINGTISTVLNAIFGITKTISEAIKSLLQTQMNAIKTSITNIMYSIKNTISNVWNGIWTIIKNIINTIISGIEKMVNSIIKGMNTMTNALNGLSFTAPDWLPLIGGKKFSLNLKSVSEVSLPRLYQGGYLKANNPQLAIVGDNTREGEIVAPESKIYEQADKAIKDNNGTGTQKLEIVLRVEYEDGKKIIKKINDEEIAAGKVLLLV